MVSGCILTSTLNDVYINYAQLFFMSRKGDGAEKEGMKAEEFRDVVGEVVED